MRIPASPTSSPPASVRLIRTRIVLVTAMLALIVTTGYLVWPQSQNAIPPVHVPPMPDGLPVAVHAEVLPAIQDFQAMQQLRRVVVEELDGQQVLRIQVVEDGDELIIDAATGTLLAVRDSEGKTTWQPVRKPPMPHPMPMHS